MAVSIVDGCTISTADVAFGLVIGTAGTIQATGAVDVQCTADLDFVIKMDRGLNNLGRNRRMRNPTSNAYMRYELYSDPGYTSRWTDRRNGQVSGNSGATGYQTLPVYGELTFDGTAVSGRYEDTVTVTIEF
ncbi:Csu type fimbrial protein [Qipengyuania flava]|uniref:Csu type fimbrial protein n=1 Tax=Qipengyuania flava TaxID=192812 RepID=UPI001C62A485|nr:spore coat U domain-containing protein [Qipengyuania flava]QYJ07300.1 spore coat U domain-containing protein [Qipengyuania flava]